MDRNTAHILPNGGSKQLHRIPLPTNRVPHRNAYTMPDITSRTNNRTTRTLRHTINTLHKHTRTSTSTTNITTILNNNILHNKSRTSITNNNTPSIRRNSNGKRFKGLQTSRTERSNSNLLRNTRNIPSISTNSPRSTNILRNDIKSPPTPP